MNSKAESKECSKEQVYRLCQRLSSLRPPIDLRSDKADETLRFWLPEIPWEVIEKFKKEYIAEGGVISAVSE
jgi:hypothetical protein